MERQNKPKLTNKLVTVTGLSRDIRPRAAIALAKQGAKVVFASRTVSPDSTLPGDLNEVPQVIKEIGDEASVFQTGLARCADRTRRPTNHICHDGSRQSVRDARGACAAGNCEHLLSELPLPIWELWRGSKIAMIPRNKKIKSEKAMQRSFPAVEHQSKRRSSIAFASMAVIASASIAGISIAQDPTPFFAGKIGGTLGTPEQIARDKLAVRIFHSAPVQREMHKLEALYAADTTAQQRDAMVTLKEAAAATAMAQSVAVVNQDPDRPAAYWAITSPHSWGDVKVPLAGVMIDDTDNVYRTIPIDGAASYEIEGKIVGTHPSQETFTLHNELSGADKNQKVRKQEVEAGFVALDKLPVDANGQFTITIDSSPANGRPNHIQSTADVHLGYILIRDTLADWSREDPVKLSVRRVGGPPVHPPKTEAELADRAAALITTAAPYWLTWAHNGFFTHPTNSYTQLVTRASGWGFIKCGRYTLKDDEALLITLDRKKAAYLGFQLSDVWGQGQATNYIENTGSLSASQVRPNPDGTYSYVISVADPGLYNWLNPRGLHSGTFCTRWQNLPESVNTDDAVRRMEVVKLADLKSIFPSDADRVTPAKREQQQRAHLADFMRRLAN